MRPMRVGRAASLGGRLATLAVCALLSAATGCSSGVPQLLPRPASTSCAHSDGVLRIATGSDLSASGVRRALIDKWADRERVKVDIVELPDDADGQRSQLVAALQSGNPDCYDLVNLDVTWTAEFAAQGLVAPLPKRLGRLLGGFWPAARASVRYADKDWAVPWNTDVGLLYYRSDLLPHPDLSTWHKLVTAVSRFERSDDRRVRSGLLTQLASYEGLTVNANEAVWRSGGTIVRGEGERAQVAVTESEAVSGLGGLAGSVQAEDPDARHVPVIGTTSLGLDELSSVEHFLSGESLMMRNWPFAASRLAQAGAKNEDKGAGPHATYGVTTLPADGDGRSGAAALGGQNLAVVAGSPDAALSEELVARLSGPGAQRCLRGGGFVPALRAAASGPCPPESLAGKEPGFAPLPEPLRTQYPKVLEKALGQARTRPVTPYYATITRDIQEHVRDLIDHRDLDYSAFADELRDGLRGH